MPTFNVTLAQTVRCYGSTQIEAATMAEAIEILRAQAETDPMNVPGPYHWDCVVDPEWSQADQHTVVSIEPDGVSEPFDGIDLTWDDPARGCVVKSKDDLARQMAAEGIPGATP